MRGLLLELWLIIVIIVGFAWVISLLQQLLTAVGCDRGVNAMADDYRHVIERVCELKGIDYTTDPYTLAGRVTK